LLLLTALETQAAPLRTKHVFLITTDGLRWEEVFRGADEAMINKEFGLVGDTNALRSWAWRPTAAERRAALFPFLWSTVASEGQLFGNRSEGSEVRVSNPHHFSYPGYSEFLTGVVDPKIDSNDMRLNTQTNVFEWLNHRPGYAGHTAAVVSWGVLPWVLNTPRSGIPIWSAFEVPAGTRRLEVPPLLDETARRGQTIWKDVISDTFVASAAFHAVRKHRVKAMYVGYGETDDWAHEGNYGRYLKAAHEFDRFCADLWQLVQSIPEYRNSTSLVISTDHGRGPSPIAWKSHGATLADSAYLWVAVLGPDTKPLGERKNVPLISQGQIAATIAALTGGDWSKVSPAAAPAIRDVIGR